MVDLGCKQLHRCRRLDRYKSDKRHRNEERFDDEHDFHPDVFEHRRRRHKHFDNHYCCGSGAFTDRDFGGKSIHCRYQRGDHSDVEFDERHDVYRVRSVGGRQSGVRQRTKFNAGNKQHIFTAMHRCGRHSADVRPRDRVVGASCANGVDNLRSDFPRIRWLHVSIVD
jgi:hypothetical protein